MEEKEDEGWGEAADLMNVSRILGLGGSFCRVLRVWRGSAGLQIPPTE